jgi:hypothetical protein
MWLDVTLRNRAPIDQTAAALSTAFVPDRDEIEAINNGELITRVIVAIDESQIPVVLQLVNNEP